MNISRRELVIPVCMVAVFVLWISGSTGTTFIPNLTERCYRCLCYVSTKCDRSYGCAGGYCGPFNISRVYWVDAGKVVMKEDDPERNHGKHIDMTIFVLRSESLTEWLEK
ncbi:hypothetical protein O3G_MSEX010747 [Manduca sexta]|uniref:lysozyme n=1 Tax=Manduca sexta TaxID=7130 RepID=A0A921ZK79_MANSE|nr:hypothetical protein O3G_MSEX010747 [Manduca sexta]